MPNTRKGLINVGPGQAEVQNIAIPTLEPGYLFVKPTAWAISPGDWYHLGLEGEGSCVGTLIGGDYAGVVVELGSSIIRDFKVGDRIAGIVSGQNLLRRQDGAFADLIMVKADIQMKVPDNLTDAEAATLGGALITIGVGLYQNLRLPLPEGSHASKSAFPIFINGGSTATGITAIQFAKLSGTLVVTTSSPSNFDYLRSLGADHILDYNSTTLAQNILSITGGPVLYVFDTHPNDTSTAVAAAILSRSSNSRYVSLHPGQEQNVKALNPEVNAQFILAYSAFGDPWIFGQQYFAAIPDDYEFQKKFIVIAQKLLAGGLVKPPRVFLNRGGSGFQGILHGLNESKDGKVSGGKLVYTA